MLNYLIIPGIGNSGPEHWQTWMERSGPNFQRVEQTEWDAPDRKDWVAAIDKAVGQYDPSDVVLVGHSLGCAAIAYWAKESGKKIRGGLLVAPSDTEAPQYKFPTKGFERVILDKIDFPTIVVASTNDEWVSLERAMMFAKQWGSEFINIGEAGHINVSSGYGPWPQGISILDKL